MYFEKGHLYHMYNQGNNRQNIFFKKENYQFFLNKIETHVLPFADILAWCLMPNHFHLMVHVNEIELDERLISPGATQSRTRTVNAKMSFNKSIGIMLASYTRAINIQESRTGSLFRKETKAICLTQESKVSPSWYTISGATQINNTPIEKEYPNICFNYIISNPIRAGLTKNLKEWEYTSYREMKEKNDLNLISNERIKEYSLEITTLEI